MATTTFQKILITTDLSEEAVKAYGYARLLAETCKASLTVLSCIDTSVQYAHGGVGTLEIPAMYSVEDSTQLLASVGTELNEHIRQYFSDISVTQEILQAPVGVEKTITTFAKEQGFDLIIMASHGRTGITRALLGSTAEYVLRHSRCPVLVVPTRT